MGLVSHKGLRCILSIVDTAPVVTCSALHRASVSNMAVVMRYPGKTVQLGIQVFMLFRYCLVAYILIGIGIRKLALASADTSNNSNSDSNSCVTCVQAIADYNGTSTNSQVLSVVSRFPL